MSTVTIEELSGKKRRLTLQGSGLPLRGAEWGGEQVVDTSWNPGSPVATQQVLGPTEAPSDWEGEWRTNRLVSLPCLLSTDSSTDQTIVLADTLRDVVDSIRISGQLLRVTWVSKPGRKRVRIGRLTKFTTNDERADDLAWHATFTWIGRDQQSAVAISDADQTLAAATAAALSATDAASRVEAQSIVTANAATPLGPTPFSLGQLEAVAEAPKQLARQFARIVTAVSSRINALSQIIATTRDAPAAVLNQLVDASTTAVEAGSTFIMAITRQGPETLSVDTRVSALLTAATYFSSIQDGAEQMASDAAKARQAAARRRSAANRPGTDSRSMTGAGDLQDVIVPRPGDTMLSISRTNYQGADLSYELSRANGLPGQTVTPPRGPLIIPRRELLAKFRLGA